MKMIMLSGIGKKAVVALAALALSVMMAPAIAFAANDVNKVNADATQEDVSVEVGDVSTDGNPGVTARAGDGHTATIKTGDVTASQGQDIIADADSRGTVSIAAGNLESDTDNGIEARTNGEATITVKAGDVSAGTHGTGVWTSASNSDDIYHAGSVTIDVGNIEAGEEGIVMRPYVLSAITVSAGDVTAKGDGVQIVSENGGQATLSVNDITSDKTGIFAYVNAGSVIDVLATGTISGKKAPIAFYGALFNDPDKFKLTVWKVALNDGNLLYEAQSVANLQSQATSGEGTDLTPREDPDNWIFSPWVRGDEVSSFEKAINYIVRLAQPIAGGTITATKADGSALEKVTANGEEYEVANQDDKILLKVNLEEGYNLVGAYNGDDEQVELLKDDQGNYYLVVPKGGGVYLSVILEQNDALTVVDLAEEAPAATKAVNAEANVGSGSTLPKTGDSVLPWALLALALLSGVALAFSRTKVRQEHVGKNVRMQ